MDALNIEIDTIPNQKTPVDTTSDHKTLVATRNQKTPEDTKSNKTISIDKISLTTAPLEKTFIETTSTQNSAFDSTTNKEVASEAKINNKDPPTASSALNQVLAEELTASQLRDGTAEQTSTKQFLGSSDQEKETVVPGPHIDNGPRGEGRKVMAPNQAPLCSKQYKPPIFA